LNEEEAWAAEQSRLRTLQPMTSKLNLHPDFLVFANHLLDEHGAAITLGQIVDLMANANADTLATETGLKDSEAVLEGVAALQADLPEATLLTDLLDQDRREKANKRIPTARAREVSVARVGAWRPQITANAHRQWDIVAGGLRLALCSLVVLLIIGLGLASAVVIAAMSSAAGPRQGTDQTISGLMCGAMVLAGLAIICNLVGQARCCAAPAESGARKWAIASLLCYLLGPTMGCYWRLHVVSTTPESQQASALVIPTCVSLAVVLLGHVLFVVALSKIGRYFRDRATAFVAICCLVFDATLVAAILAGGFVQAPLPVGVSRSPGAGQIPATAELVAFVITIAYGLAGLLLYVELLKRTRDVLGRVVWGDV
jgi:hypothetical protein